MDLIYIQGQSEIFQSMIEISAKVAGLLLAVSIVGLLLQSHPLAYRIQNQSKVIVGCMQWNIVVNLGKWYFSSESLTHTGTQWYLLSQRSPSWYYHIYLVR